MINVTAFASSLTILCSTFSAFFGVKHSDSLQRPVFRRRRGVLTTA